MSAICYQQENYSKFIYIYETCTRVVLQNLPYFQNRAGTKINKLFRTNVILYEIRNNVAMKM